MMSDKCKRIVDISVFMLRYVSEVILIWRVFVGFLWHGQHAMAVISLLFIFYPILASIVLDLCHRESSDVAHDMATSSHEDPGWVGRRVNKKINPYVIVRSGFRYINHIYHDQHNQAERIVSSLMESQDFMARYLSFPQLLVQGTSIFWECGSRETCDIGSVAWYRFAQIIISYLSLVSSTKAQLIRSQQLPLPRIRAIISHLEPYISIAHLLLMLSISGGMVFNGSVLIKISWTVFVAMMWWVHPLWSRSIFYSLAIQAGSWGCFYWFILDHQPLNEAMISAWLMGFLVTFSLNKVSMVFHHYFIGKPLVYPLFSDSQSRFNSFPRTWNHPLATSDTLIASGHFYEQFSEDSFVTRCYSCGKSFRGWSQLTTTELEVKFLHHVFCRYFKNKDAMTNEEVEVNKPLLERKPPNAVDLYVFLVRMTVYITFFLSWSQFVIQPLRFQILTRAALGLLVVGMFLDCLILVIFTNRWLQSGLGVSRLCWSALRLMINFKKHPVHGIKSTIFTNQYMLLIHGLTFGNLVMPTKCEDFCPSTSIVTCMISVFVIVLQAWPFFYASYFEKVLTFLHIHPVTLSPVEGAQEQI